MRYRISVWDGATPTNNTHAYALWSALFDESHPLVPPSPAIAELMDRLLTRWPVADGHLTDDAPWRDTDMSRSAAGRMADLDLTADGARRALPYIAQVADELGLVWWDPQVECLRVDTRPPWDPAPSRRNNS